MRPHRSTVIAVIALVFSMTGGAVAAVNYARNSAAVDGYSAVKAASSNTKAAGKLVAMDEFGKLPAKFLSGTAETVRGSSQVDVEDNSATPPRTMFQLGVGTLLVACLDEQPNPGVENPTTRIGVTNYTSGPMNIARRAGSAQGAVNTFQPNTSDTFEVGGQGSFDIQIQTATQTVFIHGGVRQTGQGTANASCDAFATAFIVD